MQRHEPSHVCRLFTAPSLSSPLTLTSKRDEEALCPALSHLRRTLRRRHHFLALHQLRRRQSDRCLRSHCKRYRRPYLEWTCRKMMLRAAQRRCWNLALSQTRPRCPHDHLLLRDPLRVASASIKRKSSHLALRPAPPLTMLRCKGLYLRLPLSLAICLPYLQTALRTLLHRACR